MPETATPIDSAHASARDSALTQTSPVTVKVFGSIVADTRMFGRACATVALNPRTPPASATDSERSETSDRAITLRPPTGPVPPIATLPTCAIDVLSTLGSESETPTASPPAAPPSTQSWMSRTALLSTKIPPPAARMRAPSAISACCSLVSLRTATWPAMPTAPVAAAIAMTSVFSVMPAYALTAPPAVTLALPVNVAVVALFTLPTRTAPPAATAPPAMATARPLNERPSSALKLTFRPAMTVPSRVTDVPRGTVVVIAVFVTPAPRTALSLIDLVRAARAVVRSGRVADVAVLLGAEATRRALEDRLVPVAAASRLAVGGRDRVRAVAGVGVLLGDLPLRGRGDGISATSEVHLGRVLLAVRRGHDITLLVRRARGPRALVRTGGVVLRRRRGAHGPDRGGAGDTDEAAADRDRVRRDLLRRERIHIHIARGADFGATADVGAGRRVRDTDVDASAHTDESTCCPTRDGQ